MNRLLNIHYSAELSLKGENRIEFEKVLVDNLKYALHGIEYERIEKKERRILVYLNEKTDIEKAHQAIARIFGISWFALSYSLERDIKKLADCVLDYAKKNYSGKKIKIETTRSDKTYSKTSMDLSMEIGKIIENAGVGIDVKKPDEKIFIEIMRNQFLVSFGKIQGLGGLPIGSSNRLLCLLSGGIDSPVASWLMMKRGCEIDFLHIHNYPSDEEVVKSKIAELIKVLRRYLPFKTRLHVVSYQEFNQATMDVDPRLELVLFRRFIAKLASEMCKENRMFGVITGDSMGQVASQTIENLYATDEAFTVPVYRPLIAYDKQDIIYLAQKIGTFDLSIEKYKDCCSLVAAKHPSTRVKLEDVKRIEHEIGIDEILEKTMKEISVVEI
ncbi:MAG: tRNA uracil 4-sulfurtransferase ThiI [Candidatus Micrarchaeota archaeon]